MNFNFTCNKYFCDKGDFKPDGNGYADFYELWFKNYKEKTNYTVSKEVIKERNKKAYLKRKEKLEKEKLLTI